MAMIIAFGLVLAINFNSRIAAGQPILEYYDEVRGDVERLRSEQGTLVAERDFSSSDRFVEQWARSEGKMIRQGEILVIPVPAGNTANNQPTPIPMPAVPIQTSPPQPENWMVWWELFFDSPPPNFSQTLP